MAIYTLTINFGDDEVPRRAGNQLILQNAPSPAGSLQLFRNGILQKAGVDYNQSSNFIVPTPAIDPADSFIAWYRY